MAFLLKPDLFAKMSPADIDKLLKQDIKNSAGKNVTFVAAKDVPIGPRKAPLFLVTDDVKAWQAVLKTLKVTAVATGECRVLAGPKPQIAVKSSTGVSKSDVVTLAKVALPDHAPVDFAAVMAQQSHEKAGTATAQSGVFKVNAEVFNVMMKKTEQLTEYQKFADAFEEMAKKYKMADYKKVPVNIWADMLKGMIKSGYIEKEIPKAEDGKSFVLAYTGADGKIVREKLLAEAMKGLQKFTAHAGTYLDKVVAEVRKAGGTPTWSFWSGTGAQAAARAENSGGVVLEGSVGSWFDKVWDFKPLTGVENLALWTSLSELYAQKAAEYYDVFSFNGFVGQGATRDQSVFNKIEQPTFIQILNAKKQVGVPSVEWYVVDCVQDGDRWSGSGKPSQKSASRDAALAEVVRRYGS